MIADLTEKEQKFVQEYLTNNYNAGKAAVSAGYSERSKYDIGYELLRKPKIKAFIDNYLKEESLEKLELVKRLSDIASNVGSEYFQSDGTVDIDSLLADGYGHVIKKIRRLKSGKVWVEFHDSSKALGDLAKIHKLIDEGVNVHINLQEEISAKQQLEEKLKALDGKLNGTINGPINNR